MMRHRSFCFALAICFWSGSMAQAPDTLSLSVTVADDQQAPLSHATVQLLRAADSSRITQHISDTTGKVLFSRLAAGNYLCLVSMVNYMDRYVPVGLLFDKSKKKELVVNLQPAGVVLQEMTVRGGPLPFRIMPGKTIVNVDAGITNAGATAMEVLEKSPGVSVGRDGSISLKGKQNVLILLDGKPAYVSGGDLVTLLSGMSAAQIDQIEIMDNPPAGYDAAGSAGVINIKTKKNRQKGFNGSLSLSAGQGRYPKSNNSLLLNYRTGKVNLFLNYSITANRNFTDLYALRSYYQADGKTLDALLEQPSYFTATGYNHTLKTGVDYFISKKTTAGITMTGLLLNRSGQGTGLAKWMDPAGVTDSVVNTQSSNQTHWKNGGINFNWRTVFDASRELTADVDWLVYKLGGQQSFQNTVSGPSGYQEQLQGNLPSDLHIFSAKADYMQQLLGEARFTAGWKTSHVTTDNVADYLYKEDSVWTQDLSKSNHFLYAENIQAVYTNLEKKAGRWDLQGGLRYEYTGYQAEQLGNAIQKDSAFSRKYNNLFPTALVSYKADSQHVFSFSAGRRIDRPAFQKLNPFVYVINKYTYEQGNPYYRPQYTWNMELSHQYKDILVTTLGYSVTRDYFSQIFLTDSTGLIIYTEGNLKMMENLSLTVSAQLTPLPFWSLNMEGTLNYKKLGGTVWNDRRAKMLEINLTMNNQFRFKKGWAAEASGFFIGRELELQEITDPAGQLSLGVSKQVFQSKGTIKLNVRDIFYSQAMQGLTHFQQATEYFKLTRDTRVCTIAFTYRFGKVMKSMPARQGGAGDEIKRVTPGG